MQNNKILFTALLLTAIIFSLPVKAQVTIGSTVKPNPNSLLDLKEDSDNYSTKGLVLPRVKLQSADDPFPLQEHVKGMFVYNTLHSGSGLNAVTEGVYYNDGSKWIAVTSLAPVTRNNTTNTVTATHGGTFTVIDGVTTDAQGRITDVNTITVTLPVEVDAIVGNEVTGATDATLVRSGSGSAASPYTLARAALTGDVTAAAGSNATTIADNAVTSAKILNGTIADADIANNTITAGKITGGTAGQVLTSNGASAASWQAEVDGIIGNEVTNATNSTLVRSGSGTAAAPYTLARAAITGDVSIPAADNTATLATVSRTNNISTAAPAHNGTFTAIDVVTTDTKGRVTAVNTKTVTLPNALPIITVQPRAFSWKETTGATTFTGVTSPTNSTVLTSATISVTATGATSYQWYEVSRAGRATAATGTGNATATYTPPGGALGMRQYYCIVSNALGSVTSDIAKVAVGCGAMTMDGGWRTFMCYNLGATQTTISGQLSYASNLYLSANLGSTPATAAQGNAAVYGDLYQWGRRPDGYEKRTSNNSLAAGPAPAGSYTAYNTAWASGGSEQITSGSTNYYGRFITAPSTPCDWSRDPSGQNLYLWRPYRQEYNDPCVHVSGVDGGNGIWRIPNQSEWGDIWRGGSSTSNTGSSLPANTANTWVWKAPGTTTHLSYGTSAGYEIKPDGVTTTLFLPAAGYRYYDSGQLYSSGLNGYYWSATAYGTFSYFFYILSGGNVIPAHYSHRANGYSVRCIAEY